MIGPAVARLTPQLLSIEAWGGATYDVALRFLAEDPWERLATLREAIPNIALQMLLRGRNTVGYTPVPAGGHRRVRRGGGDAPASTSSGSSTPSTTSSQMRPAIDAVRETGTAVAEVALCYTGDLSDPAEKLYTLDYYLRLAEQIVDAGAHVLAIKDMAGLLRAPAARTLVTALRERFDLPLHLHTHDTAGGQLATYLVASAAGVDAVDAASAPMAGTTSQPPMSALVAATDFTDRPTGLRAATRWRTWSRTGRPCGRCTRRSSPGCGRRPAGSTGTRSRAGSCPTCGSRPSRSGSGGRFEEVEAIYAAANAMLGHLVKVTPSSKVVGDLALHLVGARVDPGRLRGRSRPVRHPGLGDRVPVRRARRPARRLAGAVPQQGVGRPHVHPGRRRAERPGRRRSWPPSPAPTLNRLLFPGPDQGVPRVPPAVRRPVRAADRRLPLRPAAAASSTSSTCSPACSSTWVWRRSATPTNAACAPWSPR